MNHVRNMQVIASLTGLGIGNFIMVPPGEAVERTVFQAVAIFAFLLTSWIAGERKEPTR